MTELSEQEVAELVEWLDARKDHADTCRLTHVYAQGTNLATLGHLRHLIADWRSLRDAIRTHRDEKGDDRCWLDDQNLYATIEGDSTQERFGDRLPPRKEFLENCARFWECRQSATSKYVAASELATLRRDLDQCVTSHQRANAEIAAWAVIFDELPPGAYEIAAVVKYVADLRHDNERLREDLTATAHALDSAAGDRLNLRRTAEEMARALGDLVCSGCGHRIGWTKPHDEEQVRLGRTDWATCNHCRDARAVLAGAQVRE